MPRTALILGATGKFGRHAHAAFCAAGWQVRIFDRARDTLWDAAWGVDVIVNGWNPPYARWADDLLPQTDAIIEVAEASGATVIQPANVYVYGIEAGEVLTPRTPHRPHTSLGRKRAEVEARYKASKARVVFLRAGDFIDDAPSGNWFDRVVVEGLKRGVVTYPGNWDRPHAWAYLPDVATYAVALAEKRFELPRVADLGVEGFTLTGAQLAGALEDVVGFPLTARRFPWALLHLLRPFWGEVPGMLEMRYLWDKSHRLDGRALRELCPDVMETPLEDALAASIAWQSDINPHQPMGRGHCHNRRAKAA